MSYDGWRCPQCGGVFAPFVERCKNCWGAIPTAYGSSTAVVQFDKCLNCGQALTPNHRCVVSRGVSETQESQ